jgi:DNA repair protein RecO (recombination protein O)
MSSRSNTTTGIVIRMTNFSEQDRYITFYTPDQGKLTCIAKGIRNIKSRRGSHIELLNRVEFDYWKSKNNHYLTSCKAEDRFNEMKQSMENLSSGAFIAESIERLTPEEEANPNIYHLLNQTLGLMAFYPEKHDMLREAFLVKLLNLNGTITSFRTCSECREKLPQLDAYLNEEHSTIHCGPCTKKKTGALQRIPLETLKLMNFLIEHPVQSILKIKLNPQHFQTMSHFGRVFLRHNHPHPFKSEAFLGIY